MAKVRIGFSTQFEVENEKVGIGTDNPSVDLEITGQLISQNLEVGGTTKLDSFDGFVEPKVILATQTADSGVQSHSLSDEIVIGGEVTVSSGTTFTSGPKDLTAIDNFTLPGISDDKPTVGTTRYNEDLASLEFYTGVEWRVINSYVDMGNRGRGVFSGFSGNTNSIEYFEIMSKGNSIDFGTNTTGIINAGNSDGTRGTFSGGYPSHTNTIEYITIASTGDAINFGDLTSGKSYAGSASSSTRGLIIGGYDNPDYKTEIDYIQIQTLGDAKDFGDCGIKKGWDGSTQSPTRGVYMSGIWGVGPATGIVIEYVTMASKGNGTDFGESTQGRRAATGGGSSVRGIFCGGYLSHTLVYNTIDYVTLASTGNAIDFGDNVFNGSYSGSASNSVRMVTSGGFAHPVSYNIMAYITIASTGNAADFGDCSYGHGSGGVSDSHGGLGGF